MVGNEKSRFTVSFRRRAVNKHVNGGGTVAFPAGPSPVQLGCQSWGGGENGPEKTL